MARPPADINAEQILELASRFWKPKEIAAFFRVSERTLYNYVTGEELKQARAEGCGKLIELAWERAKTDKSPAVLIHLLQIYRDEIPQAKRALADVSNEELASEVSRRIAAAKMIQSGEFKKVLANEKKQLSAVDVTGVTGVTETGAGAKKEEPEEPQ